MRPRSGSRASGTRVLLVSAADAHTIACVRRLLVVDERSDKRDDVLDDLRGAGFEVSPVFDPSDVVAIVVALDASSAQLPACATSEGARQIPVVVVVDDDAPELRLRAAIDGAVRCVPRVECASALSAALASDAPPIGEQRRRERVAALEGLARTGASDARCRVHLTRLEHGPVRALPSEVPPAVEARLALCTPKQREILDAIAREGSVSRAAVALGTTRSSLYATLRRVAHRLRLRDSHELLRLIGTES